MNMNKGNLGDNSDSEIRQFYSGKHVFLTGCTGCLGTIILERLLYAFPDIAKVYLMIRPKKEKSTNERLAKGLQDTIFDNLREKNPNFMGKIVIVEGDLEKDGCGFSPKDRKRLLENVDIIIHNASLVHFTEKVSIMLRTNVMGTKQMLELAAECSRLVAFVYVSTAYSHPYNKLIEEKFYTPPADIKMIENVIQADEENAGGLSSQAVQDIVGSFVNIYAFSKAATEGVVEAFAKTASFPCIVFRPSIVASTYEASMLPWIGNKNGPVGPGLYAYAGFMHVLCIADDSIVDFIPVDKTVNFLLALIWNHVTNRRSTKVYNYASSDWNPCTMKLLYGPAMRYMRKYPTKQIVWYPFLIRTGNYYVFCICHTLLHIIPATIADFIFLVWKQKKPKFFKTVWRVFTQLGLLLTFMNFNWVIKADTAKELVTCMNSVDRKAFDFDLSLINWEWSTTRYVDSLRHILKETPEDLEVARAKCRKLTTLHYTISALMAFLLFFFLCFTICNFFY